MDMTEAGRNYFHTNGGSSHVTPCSTRYANKGETFKSEIPHEGTPAEAVHQLLKDKLYLDGVPDLNLAGYPTMMQMHARCVSIISQLWGVQKDEKAIGSATTGSSEAIHLGGLSMKRRWQEKRIKEDKDISKPNFIIGANSQGALEKFARYFEVEARILPVTEGSQFRLDPKLVKENIDENTIGVYLLFLEVLTLATTSPLKKSPRFSMTTRRRPRSTSPSTLTPPGGFVAPFTHAKAGGPKWNFELPRVKSISRSGHKFGLIYEGVGWIIWRDESQLPQHLILELQQRNLGVSPEESYSLNFSRPAAQIIAQYYDLIHLGFTGYRRIMETCMSNARLLSKSLEAIGWYTCISDIHRKKWEHILNIDEAVFCKGDETSADYNAGLPVVAFRFSDEFQKEFPHLKQETISNQLCAKQYIISNYSLPPNEDKIEILRVVVTESMSFELLDRLIADIISATRNLINSDGQDLSVLNQDKDTSIEEQHSIAGQSHDEG